ncbi:hypothetical protein ASPCAL08932 [Aspergillus calidoustus]|uniref:C2H2-type domain-containing protein n=1 Tax=Aspergillus calidoustus TaxID=454130 RepID=A0A0U5GTW7_ASPCI|nr:hypothetical protein ASPCAL08932 [Aspergillus calidoustus]
MEPVPIATQNQEEMLRYNLASPPEGISSWATARPDSMPLPEAASMGFQSTIQSVPKAVPVWGGTVSGPPTTDPRLDPAMNWGFQGPPQPHVHQHNGIPIGLPTQYLDLSVPSAQPSLQPQALLMNPSENLATHQSSQQALTPNHLLDTLAPTVRYYCKWERCQNLAGFKRLSEILRHIKEIHLAPDAYTCPVDGCGKTFNRAERLRHHERTHRPRIQPPVPGLRF